MERSFTFFGWTVRYRIESPQYTRDIRMIAEAIDADRYKDAIEMLVTAKKRYGETSDLVRLCALCQFLALG
jgi:hypothetical protein